MKTIKIILSLALILTMVQMQAQRINSGVMDGTKSMTFNYIKEGVKIPYTVSVSEKRMYQKEFEEVKDASQQTLDQNGSMPALVAKYITIENETDPFDNKMISLKYQKQVTDTFELVATEKGFAVQVDDKVLEYIMGVGIYFADTADEDFFIVDEITMTK